MAVEMLQWKMLSNDKKNNLHCVKWFDPDKEVKGIVQISHGMCEYVKRYDEMARFLAENGYVVCGNDHLGHGESVSREDLGYIAPKDGYLLMLKDLRSVTEKLREEYPGKKLVLYGHSMGSFLARLYASSYANDGADAYVYSGTAGPNPAAGAAKIIIKTISAIKGERHISKLMTNISFGSYLKRIPDAKTGKEWVTGDPVKLNEYINDPYCSFTFTISAYGDLINVLDAVSREDWAGKLNSALPYLLVSGKEDPVGNYGEGVNVVAERMKKAGCENTEVRLYDGIRHEPHNDVKREDFYREILGWLDEKLA